jgi:dienelactone hydrolase
MRAESWLGIRGRRRARPLGASTRAALIAAVVAGLGVGSALATGGSWGAPPAAVQNIAVEGFSGALYVPKTGLRAGSVLVIIVPDGPNGDPRSGAYLDQLLGAGLPVLDVLRVARPEALERGVAMLASTWAGQGFSLGAVAFGRGARLALASGLPFVDVALLYPGCEALDTHLPAVGPARILLLHGGSDEANSSIACSAFVRTAARGGRFVQLETYEHVGYAWDYPAFSREARFLLPRPEGEGRIATTVAPDLVPFAATRVAAFFNGTLRVSLQP